jgi:hypothetical protein
VFDVLLPGKCNKSPYNLCIDLVFFKFFNLALNLYNLIVLLILNGLPPLRQHIQHSLIIIRNINSTNINPLKLYHFCDEFLEKDAAADGRLLGLVLYKLIS